MIQPDSSMKEKSSLRRKLQWIGYIVIILLVINFCYQLWLRYDQKQQYVTNGAKCSVQNSSCLVNMRNNTSASLNVTPKDFKSGQTITLNAIVNNIPVTHVYALIFPVGETAPNIKPTALHATDDGKYQAELTVPDNKADKHKWVIMLVIQSKDNNYAIPYRFEM